MRVGLRAPNAPAGHWIQRFTHDRPRLIPSHYTILFGRKWRQGKYSCCKTFLEFTLHLSLKIITRDTSEETAHNIARSNFLAPELYSPLRRYGISFCSSVDYTAHALAPNNRLRKLVRHAVCQECRAKSNPVNILMDSAQFSLLFWGCVSFLLLKSASGRTGS